MTGFVSSCISKFEFENSKRFELGVIEEDGKKRGTSMLQQLLLHKL
jgi:hypothetical protein